MRSSEVGMVVVLAAALGACQIPPPAPSDGYDLRLGFGGVPITSNVGNLREQRFDHIVPQRLDFSCGAAALATLLQFHYGDYVEEAEIIEQMMLTGDAERIRRQGFSMADLSRFAKDRDYEAKGFEIGPDVLDQLAIPALTLVNTRGYGHFVVIKGARDGMVYLADPAMGNRAIEKGDFLKGWGGVVLFVAAERDKTLFSPLAELRAGTRAPVWLVREIDHLGLRNLMVSSAVEF